MKISIVTPSFNQVEYLEETIDSVLSQGVDDLEYIIMDGGSTDGSVDIIKRYEKHLHHWESGPDGGQVCAINAGFKKSSGDILAYLNSDDVYFPGVLNKVRNKFESNERLELLYGDNAVLYPDGRIVGKPKISFDFDICLNAFLMVQQPSSFWSRRIYSAVGGFNENYQFCFDYDFFLKVGKAVTDSHACIEHVQDLWSQFRVHDTSKTITSQREFSLETRRLRLDYGFHSSRVIRPFIKHYYLLKTLYRFYRERGIVPLRSGSGY